MFCEDIATKLDLNIWRIGHTREWTSLHTENAMDDGRKVNLHSQ